MLSIDYAKNYMNRIPYVFGGSRYDADVSGRGTDANLYERVCYLGARTAEQGEQLSDLQAKVNQILDKLNQ